MPVKKKDSPRIVKVKRAKAIKKGVDTLKYCGVLHLKETPLQIQKSLRDEWN